MNETEVDVEKIIEREDNPRKDLGDLTGLAASINEIGLVEPLVVYPEGDKFILTAGHRRLGAIKKNKMKTIPRSWLVIRTKDDADYWVLW